MKYLSFDLGLSHTGVAVSYEGKIAQGLTTITASEFDYRLKKIIDLLAEEKPDVIILGSPEKGQISFLSEQLKEQLEARLGITPIIVNEDFSTKLAQQTLLASGAKRKTRQTKDHQVAAAAILQTYLDTQ